MRNRLITLLNESEITIVYHYTPLEILLGNVTKI